VLLSNENSADHNVHGRRFLFNIGGTIDRGAEGADVERRRRENRGAVGAEGGGVLGRGQCPLPRKFFDCGSQNGEF